jgi:2-amino-4-hydroxy-6-hydroxymethyldihydropteridine diphosphokinase
MQSPRSTKAYIALGANLGDRRANIARALDLLRATHAIDVMTVSALIENPAVGGPADSPPFLNGAAEIETTLPPRALLDRLLAIEQQIGRQRRQRWDPRLIDLDLLLYGDVVLDEPDLRIPHPLMDQRRFVLEPLNEIAPDVIHPIMHRPARQLLADLHRPST